jgi:hypothetical protein
MQTVIQRVLSVFEELVPEVTGISYEQGSRWKRTEEQVPKG